jgi:hypothetical protein
LTNSGSLLVKYSLLPDSGYSSSPDSVKSISFLLVEAVVEFLILGFSIVGDGVIGSENNLALLNTNAFCDFGDEEGN